MIDYKKYATIRREFHKIPELAFQEYETKALILKYLKQMDNINKSVITPLSDTGLSVDIGIKKDKYNIAFRADIDGLKLKEETDVDYISEHDGLMHACGHDSHITIILGVIEVCLKHIEVIDKSSYGLRFIFQPAEEIGRGSLKMIECNVLNNINEIFGIHNSSGSLNEITTKKGAMMGRTDKYLITISNNNVNGDKDDKTLTCACNISNSLTQINNNGILAICSFNYDDSETNNAEIKGTIRTIDNAIGDKFIDDIKNVCEHITKIYECAYNVCFTSTKALINSEESTQFIIDLVHDYKYKLNTTGVPSMVSDDFAYYLQYVPGNYFFLG